MNSPVFVSMSDPKMASLIDAANERVAVAMPAVREETTRAICDAIRRIGCERVGLVMDCDEEVFRLGYGNVSAIETLRDAGCVIRHSSGLRIGVLVCDDRAWVFAPTALYVQAEVHSDETPNAVALRASDVERILSRIIPLEQLSGKKKAISEELRQEIANTKVEIGHEEIPRHLLEQTKEALDLAPPMAFDVAR